MKVSAEEIGKLLDGQVEGDPLTMVDRPARIEEGTPGSLTFLANPKYESYAYSTGSSIILVPRDFQPQQSVNATLIRVDDVYQSLAVLLDQFGNEPDKIPAISPLAYIHEDAEVGEKVTIGAFVWIGANAKVDSQAVLEPFCYLGEGVRVGKSSHLYMGVKIYHNCIVGKRVKIHANSVIGSDGFGFVRSNGQFQKIKQVGNVVIEDDVEIGANVVVDRASIGSTRIRSGAKLDNLIQIAHNVDIGQNTAIAAQAGIAGSTKVGDDSLIGGQAGIVGHIQIAPGTQIQAQSGVTTSSEPGDRLYGSPALDYVGYLKSYAVFKQLPQLASDIARLQKRISELEKQLSEKSGTT